MCEACVCHRIIHQIVEEHSVKIRIDHSGPLATKLMRKAAGSPDSDSQILGETVHGTPMACPSL